MTEPNDKLVEELARVIANSFAMQPGYSDFTKVARAILPILTRETVAAYQRGLRDAAAICESVMSIPSQGLPAWLFRETLP